MSGSEGGCRHHIEGVLEACRNMGMLMSPDLLSAFQHVHEPCEWRIAKIDEGHVNTTIRRAREKAIVYFGRREGARMNVKLIDDETNFAGWSTGTVVSDTQGNFGFCLPHAPSHRVKFTNDDNWYLAKKGHGNREKDVFHVVWEDDCNFDNQVYFCVKLDKNRRCIVPASDLLCTEVYLSLDKCQWGPDVLFFVMPEQNLAVHTFVKNACMITHGMKVCVTSPDYQNSQIFKFSLKLCDALFL